MRIKTTFLFKTQPTQHTMKPRKITIQGFGPYGPEPQVLAFTDGPVLVLMGTNGGGKSSVIEAQLWARYGTCISRNGGKIINNSCESCVVTEEAVVAGRLYKWTRTLKRTKKGGTEGGVDLQVMQNEKWVSINEKTAGQTTDKITAILGVDFDAAICTDVLAQGNSGAFSNLGPKDKTGVLGQVLKHGTYQEMADKAGTKAKTGRDEALKLTGAIEVALLEVAQIPEVETGVTEKELGLAPVKIEVAEIEKRVESCRRVVDDLAQKERKAEELKREADIYRKQHGDLNLSWQEKVIEIQQITAQLEKIAGLQQIINEAGNVDDRVIEHAKKREMYRTALSAVELAEERHESKGKALNTAAQLAEITLSRARQDVLSIGEEIADIEKITARKADLKAVPDGDVNIESAAAADREAREALGKITENYAVKNSECKATDAKIKQLSEYDGAVCEFCGSDLTGEHKDRELERLDSNLRLAQAERDELIKDGTAAREKLLEAEQNLAEVRKNAQALELRRAEIANLDLQLRRGPELAERMEAAKRGATIAETEKVNAEKSVEDHDADETVIMMRNDLGAIRYDREAESRDLAVQSNVKDAREEVQKSAERQARADVLAREVRELQGKMLELDGQINPLAEQVLEITEYVQRHKNDAADQVATVEAELRGKRGELSRAESEIAAAQMRLESLRKTDAGIAGKKAEISGKEKEVADYEALQKALGPNGVQAMLIDQAAPAIEWEANQVLARIAPGAKIRIDTQKETLEGKMKEGLEITVIDESGELPYGAYSGGYKFRLDVAIRVALSNVLGAMGGGGERTLTIDEGFGSLDAGGVESMIAAIYDVVAARYFDKIIIISHLDEIKAAFDEVAYFSRGEDGFAKINFSAKQ